jgi:hypothetical protein
MLCPYPIHSSLLASFLYYILPEPADHSSQICVTRLSSRTLEHSHIWPVLLLSKESPANSKMAFIGRLIQSFANVNENIAPCSGPFLQIFRKQQHLNDGKWMPSAMMHREPPLDKADHITALAVTLLTTVEPLKREQTNCNVQHDRPSVCNS